MEKQRGNKKLWWWWYKKYVWVAWGSVMWNEDLPQELSLAYPPETRTVDVLSCFWWRG